MINLMKASAGTGKTYNLAKTYLTLTAAQTRMVNGETQFHNVSRFVKEIPDGSSIDKPILGEFGILVPDMDEEENFDPEYVTEGERILAEQMERILDDEELLRNYSDKSYERATVYAPDKYKESIHEILKRYE